MSIDTTDRISILRPTNTQTRRLGYITQICRMLNGEPYPRLNLISDLESWASSNQQVLDGYLTNKGVIRTSGKSLGAKRYINLAQELEFISESAGYLRLTKTGRVLLTANEECSQRSPLWPFELTLHERIIFTYQLLLSDSDYLLPLLQATTTHHKQTELQEVTQTTISKHFEILARGAQSPIVRSEALDRVASLSSWKKPKKYSEHLALPRLHWLLDLKLLDWRTFKADKEFRPSKSGQYLLDSLQRVNGERILNRDWCQNDFFLLLPQLLEIQSRRWVNLSTHEQDQLIGEHVSLGFSHFRTMEYPRISAYQLVLFTVTRLLLCRNIAAGFEEIKYGLSRNSSSGRWVFYWTAMDDDGYILSSA